MNASVLLSDLRSRGAIVRAERGEVVVSAPKGLVTADDRATLAVAKSELLRLLLDESSGPFSPLVEYAASVLPKIRLTIRETGDTKRDFDLLGDVRRVIQEYQPGGNHIYVRIVQIGRESVVVEWRALADRELRMALGRMLARTALNERTR